MGILGWQILAHGAGIQDVEQRLAHEGGIIGGGGNIGILGWQILAHGIGIQDVEQRLAHGGGVHGWGGGTTMILMQSTQYWRT